MIPVLPIPGDVPVGPLACHRKGVAEYRFEMLHLFRVDAGTQTASRVLVPAGIGRLEQVSVLARQLLVKQYARKSAVTHGEIMHMRRLVGQEIDSQLNGRFIFALERLRDSGVQNYMGFHEAAPEGRRASSLFLRPDPR